VTGFLGMRWVMRRQSFYYFETFTYHRSSIVDIAFLCHCESTNIRYYFVFSMILVKFSTLFFHLFFHFIDVKDIPCNMNCIVSAEREIWSCPALNGGISKLPFSRRL